MKIMNRGSSKKRFHLSFLFLILVFLAMLLLVKVEKGFAETVTLTPTQDAYVSDIIPDTTTNASWLEVGRHSAGYYRKSFLQFDISSIPPSTNIDEAVLILRRVSPVGSFEMIVKMVAEAWSENTVTWNNFPITHTFPFNIVDPTEGPDTVTIDVTELVEEWLSGNRDNYGFILSVNPSVIPSGNHVAFGSSENSDPSYHPKLEITFPEYAEPDINLNGTSHDYGNIELYNYSDWTLTISNQGNADLIVDAPFQGLGGTDWAITPFYTYPFTIIPGDNEAFTLRFRPTQTGYRECNLRIQSNDPDEPDLTVHLYGTGGTVEPVQLQFGSSTYNVSENEGSITITVTRTNGSDGTVTVDYATSNGSAIAGSDYTAISDTLTFSDGETSETFTVSIIDDSAIEGDETVNLSLSNPTAGAALGSPSTAVLTIVDTSGVGIPGNLYASKGDYPDKVRLTFTKGTNAHSTMVYRNTIDDSISATLLDGAVIWEYYDDTSAEPGITYYYWVKGAGYSGTSDFSGSVTGWVGTDDPDEPGQLQFGSSTYNVKENEGSITITVTRTNGSDGTVTVDYATSNGSATAGSDYTATSGTLTFSHGEAIETFTVSIIDDSAIEGNETVSLSLSNTTGGATLGSPSIALLTIIDTGSGDDNPVWLNQYFPLMVNNSWTYEGGIRISVDGIETVDSVQTKKVYRSDQDGYLFFTQDQEGTRRFKEEIPSLNVYGIFEPPLKELPANAFVGTTYSYSSTEKVYDTSGTLQDETSVGFTTNVLGFENVTLSIPADINGNSIDSFPDCLKLSHTLTGDGLSMSETCWYAKDLGMVKISGQYSIVQLTNATTYYDGTLSGVWRGRILDSGGVQQGDLNLTLTQTDSRLSGNVGLNMNNGDTYNLPIQNAYASGPNAVVNASDGVNDLDLALTHNGDYLTGPYNSNFMGYGSVAPPTAEPIDNGGSGGGGGCFIATAAYGSSIANNVVALKDFRDNILLKNSVGRSFMRFYYEISPPLADYIGEHQNLRIAVRLSLTPIVYGVKHPKTSALIFLFTLTAITLALRVRRSNRF